MEENSSIACPEFEVHTKTHSNEALAEEGLEVIDLNSVPDDVGCQALVMDNFRDK